MRTSASLLILAINLASGAAMTPVRASAGEEQRARDGKGGGTASRPAPKVTAAKDGAPARDSETSADTAGDAARRSRDEQKRVPAKRLPRLSAGQ